MNEHAHDDPDLNTPDEVTHLMDNLTFSPEIPDVIPPQLAPGEDVMVPRSVRIPQSLDAALAAIAARRGIDKTTLMRSYLQSAVAADMTAEGQEVLIPLQEALRVLTGLSGLPRTAA